MKKTIEKMDEIITKTRETLKGKEGAERRSRLKKLKRAQRSKSKMIAEKKRIEEKGKKNKGAES